MTARPAGFGLLLAVALIVQCIMVVGLVLAMGWGPAGAPSLGGLP